MHRRGPEKGIRRAVLLQDATGRRGIREHLHAGHVDRPAADSESSSGMRQGRKGRRRSTRSDRQRQRPSAIRTDVHGTGPEAEDYRAVEGR